jgi:hypothetical protein
MNLRIKNYTALVFVGLLSGVAFGQNVGIGTAAPVEKLHVVGNIRATSLAGVGTRVVGTDVNGSLLVVAPGSNGQVLTQTAGGPAFQAASADWTLLGNAGTAAATNFIGTTDAVDFVVRTSNTERMRVQSGGNVGIGTNTPGYRLDLAGGSFAFGSSNVRSETRDNAGLQGNAGAQSGFFETVSPTNYPVGAASWWHLIDVRHSNNANNYALQIAGSFYDQDLYYRKTNGSATQPWSRFLTTANNLGWMTSGNAGTNAATNYIGTTDGNDFVTRTNSTERMRVTVGGFVGINTTTPSERLQINGDLRMGLLNPPNTGTLPSYGNYINFSGGNTGPTYNSENSDPIWMSRYNAGTDLSELRLNLGDNCDGGDAFVIQAGGAGCGANTAFFRFDATGTAFKPGGGSWAALSDRRVKRNVQSFTDGLNLVNAIRPITYQYNGLGGSPDNGKTYTGVIAQELQAVAPYMVDASGEFMTVDPSAFTYVLLNAVKEQQVVISALKAKDDATQAELARLRAEIEGIQAVLKGE